MKTSRPPPRGSASRTGMVICAVAAAMLAGCAILPYDEPPERERTEPRAGEVPSLPVPGEPAPVPERSPRPTPLPAPEPAPEPLPPPSYHPAGEALLEQARREMLLDNDALAGATLERALRVDGNNPWIWIELGHLRLAAGQRGAAESLARKALSLANRDPGARDAAARLLQQAGGSR